MVAYNTATGAKIPDSPMVQKNITITRPANTTQYAAGDAVAPVTATVTGATNANPSVVTTSGAHGLVNDDRVTIAGSVGNTAINGNFKVVVLSSTTFSLKTEAGAAVAGNGAWTSGGTVQKMLRFADVVPFNGGSGEITAIKLQVRNPTVTAGTFRVRFMKKPWTQIADNAAYTLLDANKADEVGYVDLTILTVDGTGSDMSEVIALLPRPLPFTCDANRADLFAQITTLGTFTPASGDTFRLEITIKRDQVSATTKLSMR